MLSVGNEDGGSLSWGSVIMDIIFHVLTLFVTFLHELGHVTAALLTGGSAHSLQVNPDGSGLATTSGGIRSVVEAGGYIGSIVFGNILLRVGILHSKTAKVVLAIFGGLMVLSSVIWISTAISFMFTMTAGLVLVLISRMKNYVANVLVVLLGLYSVFYVIQDYDVGPSSDLSAFSGVIPANVWMYVWLGVAVAVTALNGYSMARKMIKKI